MGISVVCMSQVILCMTLRLRRGWLHLERKGGFWDLSKMQRRYIYILWMSLRCHILVRNTSAIEFHRRKVGTASCCRTHVHFISSATWPNPVSSGGGW